jgi:hypothetical protein
MLELRYMLIAVVCVLILFISLITMKYRKLLRTREVEMSKEEVLGRLFLRKIRKVGESAGKEEPRELFNRLNRVMRNFFSELYEISYEFAYVELNEELVKKGVEESTRNAIIDYTMRMAEAEYSNHKMTEQEFYYLLEKSIKTIERVTGRTEEEMKKVDKAERQLKAVIREGKITEEVQRQLPKKRPAEEPEKPAPAPEPPAEKRAVEPEPEEKPEAEPEPVKVTERKEIEIPHKAEEELEREMIIPKKDEERVDKLRRLLVKAEGNMSDMKPKEAMDNYIDLRVIYDSMTPDLKMKINPETKRIIALYNSLLKEYKGVLTGKK